MTAQLLSGVRVLELGSVIAGNFGGMLLAEMGAEVIKIEPPSGDAARNVAIAPMRGDSAIHLHMNRGKKSVVLDLKSEAGVATFLDLVRTSDACTDNMRPGVMERLGLGPDELKKVKPDLVCCSVTGFGSTGPKRGFPAYDLVIQAMSGHMHMTGEPDGPPARMGAPMADLSGGVFSCIAVLAGVIAERAGRRTEHFDISMLESLVSLIGYDTTLYLNEGSEARRLGSAHAYMVPWQAFATDDGYLVIAAREDKFWDRLAVAIGRGDLVEDPRTNTNLARLANRGFTVTAVQDVLLTAGTEHWLERLAEADVPAAPVNDLANLFDDDHVHARGVVGEFDHATLGPLKYAAGPVRTHRDAPASAPAPVLGEHTNELLRQSLGYTEDRIAELRDSGAVIAWSPSNNQPNEGAS